MTDKRAGNIFCNVQWITSVGTLFYSVWNQNCSHKSWDELAWEMTECKQRVRMCMFVRYFIMTLAQVLKTEWPNYLTNVMERSPRGQYLLRKSRSSQRLQNLNFHYRLLVHYYKVSDLIICWSQRPSGLRRASAADCLQEFRVWIPSAAGMSLCVAMRLAGRCPSREVLPTVV